nr:WbqC family protein [uncultured Methanoregula sp.]
MRVGIHQPMYLPWCGLFDRIARSDLFILLDNVQYSKNYFINRNKIRTPQGWTWLTVPVISHGKSDQLIRDVETDGKIPWEHQHWKSISVSYAKAPYFKEYAGFFDEMYSTRWVYLNDVIKKTLTYLLQSLDIPTRIILASELDVTGKKNEYILNLCQNVGADEYLSGPDGRNYLNLPQWQEAGIEVLFHEYQHPEYPQLYGTFEPNMSVIDLLFNCGKSSKGILMAGQPDYRSHD